MLWIHHWSRWTIKKDPSYPWVNKNPSHHNGNCMLMSPCGTNSWTPCTSLWPLGIQGQHKSLAQVVPCPKSLTTIQLKAPYTAHSSPSMVTSRCGLHDQPSSLSSQTCILIQFICQFQKLSSSCFFQASMPSLPVPQNLQP